MTGKTDHLENAADRVKKTAQKLNDRKAKIGWVVLWLLGVPLPILLILYLLMGR